MSLYRKYRGVAHRICNSKHSVLKNIPIDFHDGLSFYHKSVSRSIQRTDYLLRRKNWKINNLYISLNSQNLYMI